jgi:pre-mRNA-splicing factor CWC26
VGAPPNRFSIKPGRHWDGVDRGTGFEQEMFKAVNDRSAKRQADWKYGQSMWE